MFLMDGQFAPWLSGEAGSEHLKAVPNDHLQRWPVSKHSLRHAGELIGFSELSQQSAQLRLACLSSFNLLRNSFIMASRHPKVSACFILQPMGPRRPMRLDDRRIVVLRFVDPRWRSATSHPRRLGRERPATPTR